VTLHITCSDGGYEKKTDDPGLIGTLKGQERVKQTDGMAQSRVSGFNRTVVMGLAKGHEYVAARHDTDIDLLHQPLSPAAKGKVCPSRTHDDIDCIHKAK
jgi:hypothetical protein